MSRVGKKNQCGLAPIGLENPRFDWEWGFSKYLSETGGYPLPDPTSIYIHFVDIYLALTLSQS